MPDNSWIDDSIIHQALKNRLPPNAPRPPIPSTPGGGFQPSQWTNNFVRPGMPGSFQPSQWARNPPAPTAPQMPPSMALATRGAFGGVPGGGAPPAAGGGAMPPMAQGGGGMGAMGRMPLGALGAPMLGLAQQRDTVSPEKAAAMQAWLRNRNQQQLAQRMTSAMSGNSPLGAGMAGPQKDQSRMPQMPPSQLASMAAAPIAGTGPTMAGRVPMPQPRPPMPPNARPMPRNVPMPQADPRMAQAAQNQSLLQMIFGHPVNRDLQLPNA